MLWELEFNGVLAPHHSVDPRRDAPQARYPTGFGEWFHPLYAKRFCPSFQTLFYASKD